VQYRWLRQHGLERRRVDEALAALHESLSRRVHRPPDPALAAGAGRAFSGTSAPAVASGREGRTGRDLAAMARNVNTARRMGIDPAQQWPGQAGLPGRPTVNLTAAGLPDLRVPARPGRPRAFEGRKSTDTTSGANLRAQGGRRRRSR
jgi:hypothetical protein